MIILWVLRADRHPTCFWKPGALHCANDSSPTYKHTSLIHLSSFHSFYRLLKRICSRPGCRIGQAGHRLPTQIKQRASAVKAPSSPKPREGRSQLPPGYHCKAHSDLKGESKHGPRQLRGANAGSTSPGGKGQLVTPSSRSAAADERA
jgi:hypothetical protein